MARSYFKLANPFPHFTQPPSSTQNATNPEQYPPAYSPATW
jgi:hypothetical protein